MTIMIRCQCKSEYSKKKTSCPTCGASKDKKAGYKVRVRVGKKVKVKTCKTLKEAMSIEADFKVKKDRGERFVGIPTLAQVWKSYEEYINDTTQGYKESRKDDKQRYKYFLAEEFGHKKLTAIESDDISWLIKEMDKEAGKNSFGRQYAPRTQMQVIALIKRLFNYSKIKFGYQGTNPAVGIKPASPIPEYRHKSLQKEKCKKFFEKVDQYAISGGREEKLAVLAIQFALASGRRRGEIFSLRWEKVDLKNKQVCFEKTKNGDDVWLPLSTELIELFEQLKQTQLDDNPLVWHTNSGKSFYDALDKHFRAICSEAKIHNKNDFRFHDLRHMFATYLAGANYCPLSVLKKLMGHKCIQTTEKYVDPIDEDVRAVMNKFHQDPDRTDWRIGGQK